MKKILQIIIAELEKNLILEDFSQIDKHIELLNKYLTKESNLKSNTDFVDLDLKNFHHILNTYQEDKIDFFIEKFSKLNYNFKIVLDNDKDALGLQTDSCKTTQLIFTNRTDIFKDVDSCFSLYFETFDHFLINHYKLFSQFDTFKTFINNRKSQLFNNIFYNNFTTSKNMTPHKFEVFIQQLSKDGYNEEINFEFVNFVKNITTRGHLDFTWDESKELKLQTLIKYEIIPIDHLLDTLLIYRDQKCNSSFNFDLCKETEKLILLSKIPKTNKEKNIKI